MSCKKFLSYIYFVGFFLIAQNTKTERLDSVSPLKLCLPSELPSLLGGKGLDAALVMPPPPPMDSFLRELYLALSFSASIDQPLCVHNPGPFLGRSRVFTPSQCLFCGGEDSPEGSPALCTPLPLTPWRKLNCYKPPHSACQTDCRRSVPSQIKALETTVPSAVWSFYPEPWRIGSGVRGWGGLWKLED